MNVVDISRWQFGITTNVADDARLLSAYAGL